MQLTFSFDLTFVYLWFGIVIIIASVVQSPNRRGKGVITVSIKKKVNCLNRRIASSGLCVAYQNGRNAQFGRKCLFWLTLPQQKRTFLHSQLHIEICEKHIKKEEKIQIWMTIEEDGIVDGCKWNGNANQWVSFDIFLKCIQMSLTILLNWEGRTRKNWSGCHIKKLLFRKCDEVR